jgi:hypothetical protein
MTRDERAALNAMTAAPWMTEALAVDYAAEVLVARGLDRPVAERLAQRVFDDHLKLYGGAG